MVEKTKAEVATARDFLLLFNLSSGVVPGPVFGRGLPSDCVVLPAANHQRQQFPAARCHGQGAPGDPDDP